MKLIFLSILLISSLFGEAINYSHTSSSQQSIPYKLKDWEYFVYKKGDKFYKAYTSNLYSGTGIFINEQGLARIVIKRGLMDGKYELFDKNGAILIKEKYSSGIKNGLSEKWENDKKVQSINYKKGIACEGWKKDQHSDLVFKECKKTGWEYLSDNSSGEGTYKKIYDSNDIVNITALDQNGKEIVEINSKSINKCQVSLEDWDYKYGKGSLDEFYKINYSLKNQHVQTIKSVEGGLYFQDLLGNLLYGIALTKDVSISPMKTTSFSDNYLIDQFKKDHYKMKHTEMKDVQTELDIKKIVFEDNTILICN